MTVNYGIDLGTTNSAIAKYADGTVEVFKNPIGHKETLPSVIAFRSGRIIIGDKAREYQEKDPKNVISSFKRKMGTTESFLIDSLGDVKSPVELSSYVLKELKNFVYTGDVLDSIVITIPASFDTIQSNATKKAGYLAGFNEVFLLQEPIAASLAFMNKAQSTSESMKQWLVYDLGGGTFDVALVKTENGEMRVLDHIGDNFLGGMDFDNLIVEKIIIPHLNERADFPALEQELRSSRGKYNSLYYLLLQKAEEVKLNLTAQESADIEFEIETPDGETLEIFFSITREQFENCIQDKIIGTIAMIKEMMERNHLNSEAISSIMMVGGSTYIPLVKRLVFQHLHIPVSTVADPTTAVVIGAAFYAGTKKTNPKLEAKRDLLNGYDLQISTAYNRVSQDVEECLIAQVSGNWKSLFYRIIRSDGGFDSGLKQLQERISEYLPLVDKLNNSFELKVFDSKNQVVFHDDTIQIACGKYNISGQPLPNDICLEIDDPLNGVTKLEVVFEKNSLLPLRKTLTKEISNTIMKGSDEGILINILEGSHAASASSNQSIGQIEIKGRDLTFDLIKGSDVEISLEISESRDLKISAFLLMTDQEFSNVFSPSERHVNVDKLGEELKILRDLVENEEKSAVSREDYELSQQLNIMCAEARELLSQLRRIPEYDVTDAKYQLEDKKRSLSRRFDEFTKDKKTISAKANYFSTKKRAVYHVEQHGNEHEKALLTELIRDEKQTLASNNPLVIDSLTESLNNVLRQVTWRLPEHIITLYYYYSGLDDEYVDKVRAAQLKEKGNQALERKNYEEIKVIIGQLYQLLPAKEQAKIQGTGIQ